MPSFEYETTSIYFEEYGSHGSAKCRPIIRPLDQSDPWGAYAEDQLALLDHLAIDRFHVMGCCIGGSFALKLIEQAPARVAAAVLEQPGGIAGGHAALYEGM